MKKIVLSLFLITSLIACKQEPKAVEEVEETVIEEVVEISGYKVGDTATDFDCWTKYYQYLVKNESVEIAFEDLRSQYGSSTYLQSQCHQVTHVIGRAEIDKEDVSVGEAYQKGDSFCWSGYFHGVM